jgi:hypothetical protein
MLDIKVLFKLDTLGNIRIWKVQEYFSKVTIWHGVLNGKLRKEESIYTSQKQEFIHKEVNKKFKKQIKLGYYNTIKEAVLGHKDGYKFLKPMLIQNKIKIRSISNKNNFYVQYIPKENACIVVKLYGSIISVNNEGKRQELPSNILKDLNNLPECCVLDGYLNFDKRSNKVFYLCTDVMLEDNFTERMGYLKSLHFGESIKIDTPVPLKFCYVHVSRLVSIFEKKNIHVILKRNDKPYIKNCVSKFSYILEG